MPLLTKSRYPGISVVLFKNVGRQFLSGTAAVPGSSKPSLSTVPVSARYSGQNAVLDVTGYLGEQGSVRTHKSVRDPAGTFTIEFTDQLVPTEDDDLYGLFEPMDIVEIRMAANPWQYQGQSTQLTSAPTSTTSPTKTPTSSLPIMMRGFISVVSRRQAMGSDGKPSRKVIISGQDYGKIWQIYNIYYNPWMPDAGNYITQFKLFTRFGLAFQPERAGKFVSDVFAKIINPFIVNMQGASAGGNTVVGALPQSSAPLVQVQVDSQISDGSVAPFGVNDWQGGSVYELLQSFCDAGPWNELFIEDREAGPFVVFRPNPFLKAGSSSGSGSGDATNPNDYINGNTSLPSTLQIDASYIISIDVSRSDANVANYYWVEQPQYDVSFGFLGKAMSLQGQPTFDITLYGNSASALYGYKRMNHTTNQYGVGISATAGTPAAQNQRDANLTINFIGARRAALIAQNQDNVVFESGTMRIIGNENIKAGTYLYVQHGNMNSKYYVVACDHEFTPMGTYITTAHVERGTGFLDRVQKGGGSNSPYWSELADSQLNQ